MPKKEKPDWTEIAAAYDEAAEHLEMAAAEPIDEAEKAAFKIVAKRLRAAGARVGITHHRRAAMAGIKPTAIREALARTKS